MGQEISIPQTSQETRMLLEKQGRERVHEWRQEAEAKRHDRRTIDHVQEDQTSSVASAESEEQKTIDAVAEAKTKAFIAILRRVDSIQAPTNNNPLVPQAPMQSTTLKATANVDRPATVRNLGETHKPKEISSTSCSIPQTRAPSASDRSGSQVQSSGATAPIVAQMPGTINNSVPVNVAPKLATQGRQSSHLNPRSPVHVLSAATAQAVSEAERAEPNATVAQAHPSKQPPKWYTDLKQDKKRGKDYDADNLLLSLRENINKAISNQGRDRDVAFDTVRKMLHKIAFVPVNEKLLRNHGMLHYSSDRGLPRIFDPEHSRVAWPFDIKSDAEELFNKWCSRIFETDLLRGIDVGYSAKGNKGGGSKADQRMNNHSSDKLDKNWVAKHPPVREVGENGLKNGQWWPTMLTALRDNAHGMSQSGIYYKEGDGAHSCVLSGGSGHVYDDVDDGEVVLYNGTDGPGDGTISKGTQSLIDRVGSGVPVRLLRSHHARSRWAPRIGVRYDGLYDVVEIETRPSRLDDKQRHRFRLVRRAGQDPIRGGDCNELAVRPTQEEINEYEKDKRFRGFL